MEILIFGVILVGFMVFISTKIKKSAASAFEREIIDREGFRIIKPEGFINPINTNSGFAFEAYSKEFGKNDADEFHQASANLIEISDSDLNDAIERIKNSGAIILSKNFSEDASKKQKICLLESEKFEKGIKVGTIYKIVESVKQRKIYQLQISVLDSYRENFADKVNEMVESFAVE